MYKVIFFSVLALLFVSFDAAAGVTFLPAAQGSVGSGKYSGPNKFQPNNSTKCRSAGYVVTTCPKGSTLIEQCPYDKRYYKKCNTGGAYQKVPN